MTSRVASPGGSRRVSPKASPKIAPRGMDPNRDFMTMMEQAAKDDAEKELKLKRQLQNQDDAFLAKLNKGKATKQSKLIDEALREQAALDQKRLSEVNKQQDAFLAKLAQGKKRNQKKADDSFQRLRKFFLGAIKKLPESKMMDELRDVEEFIRDGTFDINKPLKDNGETFLHTAVKYGKKEIVEWLITHHAHINAKNMLGDTPVHFAAQALDASTSEAPDEVVSEEIARLLITAGGDFRLPNNASNTPASIASVYGYDFAGMEPKMIVSQVEPTEDEDYVDAVEEVPVPVDETPQRVTAAALAAMAAEPSPEEEDDHRGSNPDGSAWSPNIPAGSGLPGESSGLEIMGPPSKPPQDPKLTKRANIVFLQLSDLFKDIDTSRNEADALQLLKQNQDLIRDGYLDLSKPVKHKKDGSTFLHNAVYFQKPELVRVLLSGRADPNRATLSGETPLHFGCALADREHGKQIVSLLLEAGGNPFVSDYRTGKTPFENAPTDELRKWMNLWQGKQEKSESDDPDLINQMDELEQATHARVNKMSSQKDSADQAFLAKLLKGKSTKSSRMVDSALQEYELAAAKHAADQQRQLDALQAKLLRGKKNRNQGDDANVAALVTAANSGDTTALQQVVAMGGDITELPNMSGTSTDDVMNAAMEYQVREQKRQALLKRLETASESEKEIIMAQLAKLSEEAKNNIISGPHAAEQAFLARVLAGKSTKELDTIADAIQRWDLSTNPNLSDVQREAEMTATRVARGKRRKQAIAEATAEAEALGHDLDLSAVVMPPPIIPPQIVAKLIQAAHQGDTTAQQVLSQLQGSSELVSPATVQLERAQQLLIQAQEQFHQQLTHGKTTKQGHILEDLMRQWEVTSNPTIAPEQRQEAMHQAKMARGKMQRTPTGDAIVEISTSAVTSLIDRAARDDVDAMAILQDINDVEPKIAEAAAQAVSATQAVVAATLAVAVEQAQSQKSHTAPLETQLSEETKATIMKVADLPSELLEKLDVDIMGKLRDLSEAEAGELLAREIAKNKAEMAFLAKLLKGKGLSKAKLAELEAQKRILEANAAMYDDLLNNMMNEEKKKQSHMSKEERLAHERLLAKMAARAAARAAAAAAPPPAELPSDEVPSSSPPEAVEAQVQAQVEAQAEAVAVDVTATMETLSEETKQQMMKVAETTPALLDSINVDIMSQMRTLSEAEAAQLLAREMAKNKAEMAFLQKRLNGKGMSKAQIAELEAQRRVMEANAAMYNDLLNNMMKQEKAKAAHMSNEEKLAEERLKAKMAARAARTTTTTLSPADADTLATMETQLNDSTKAQIMQVAELTPDLIDTINIGIMGRIKHVSEPEAVQMLTREMTKNQAEIAVVHKKVQEKGISKNKLAELEAQRRIMETNAAIYEDLLTRKAKISHMNADETVAFTKVATKMVASAAARGVLTPAPDTTGTLELSSMSSPQLAAALAAFTDPDKSLEEQLSDVTKMSLIQVAALNPELLEKLDVDIMSKLRELSEAEAAQMIAKEIAKNKAEMDFLAKMLKGKGLSKARIAELEAQRRILEANANVYKDLLAAMMNEQNKKQNAMSKEERLAHERLMAKMVTWEHVIQHIARQVMPNELVDVLSNDRRIGAAAKKRKADAAAGSGMSISLGEARTIPTQVMKQIAQMTADYIHSVTGKTVDVPALARGDITQDELSEMGVDIDLMSQLRNMTLPEATKWIDRQLGMNDAELKEIAKAAAQEGLTTKQRDELTKREATLQATNALYEKVMSTLIDADKKMGQQTTDEASIMEKMAQKLAARQALHRPQPSTDLSSSTPGIDGLSIVSGSATMGQSGVVMKKMDDLVFEQMKELAAEHLGTSVSSLQSMNITDLAAELLSAGIETDFLEQLQSLSQAAAAKFLARQAAQNQAEQDMIKKLLMGKGLSAAKRDELLARQKLLEDTSKLYNDMLATLMAGEKKKLDHMTEEERLAHERMMAKLASRIKKSQADVPANSPLITQLDSDGQPILAPHPYHDASTDVLDVGLFTAIRTLMAAHVGHTYDEMKHMSTAEVKEELALASIDITFLDSIRRLRDDDAGKLIATQFARDQGQVEILKKMMATKDLTPDQRLEMTSRHRQLESNAQLYADMQKAVQEHQKRKRAGYSGEDDDAVAKLKAKMLRAKAATMGVFRRQLELDALFDSLARFGAWDCMSCGYTNAQHVTSCAQCSVRHHDGRLPPGEIILSDSTILRLHQQQHACTCRSAIVSLVIAAVGPCTRANFLEIMQGLTIACRRDEMLYWDLSGIDVEHVGGTTNHEAELVWAFNSCDVPNQRFQMFTMAHLNERDLIGADDFREDLVQMPNVQDYL